MMLSDKKCEVIYHIYVAQKKKNVIRIILTQ